MTGKEKLHEFDEKVKAEAGKVEKEIKVVGHDIKEDVSGIGGKIKKKGKK